MPRSAASTAILRDARIMIVDDQEPNVRLLEAILRRDGLRGLTSVTDSRRALELVREVRPDLILLDLHMPHVDGFEMLERLKALRDGDGYLPILVLTADVDPAARQRALSLGAHDFVTKPFDAVEVVLRARNLLETRFLYRELERRNIQLRAEVEQRTDEARAAVAARTAVLASLGRLQPGASFEQTTDAMCVEFCAEGGFDAVYLLAVDAGGSVSAVGHAPRNAAAKADVDAVAARIGVTELAATGAWAEEGLANDAPLTRWFAPIRSGDTLMGLLVATRRAPAPSEDWLTLVSEYAAVARAILIPALSVRRQQAAQRSGVAAVIARRAFRPVFQPIVDIGTGAPVGFEALTRFDDAMTPQTRFIEAERIGLGVELEEATMTAAMEGARVLPESCWLSLNVSPAVVVGGRLVRILNGLDRQAVLEITEHVAITDYDAVRDGLARLGSSIRLAIDDAGAGFSSLRHVLELCPQFVKLDRTLVHGVEADESRQALVTGMRYFAETTDCTLIAEGVETQAERDALARLGVPYAQGYLFGRPAAGPALARDVPARAARAAVSGRR